MASATPLRKSNPKIPKKKSYPVGGIQVEFPYRPYGTQLAFMGRVISTLDRALREGHCHALLEAPTGTGKSLSLLCSTIAWQQSYKTKNLYVNISPSKPAPEALSDPLVSGGGFVPQVQPSTTAQPMSNNKSQKKGTVPTIYYASRTHTQISQVVREYKKTAYRVPMAVLASRKHYCTNKHIRGKENIDEECKLLLSDQEVGCCEFKNMHKVKSHLSLQKGGCHEAHDIEDLVKIGQVVKGCSYYAARSMADDAQLVFCPYNYIVNPVIRGAMDVDIKGAILILDEAHNIEDIARDAGSVNVKEDILHKLQTELEQLCTIDALIYQPLYEMAEDLISWIDRRKDTLEKHEFQHYVSCWTGDKALRELEEANISRQCFPILLECATKAIKAATDTESEIAHLSGMSVITLEGLFSSLTYFFSRNGSHIYDYQLALQRYVKKDPGKASGGWTHTLNLWCLNPAVVFRDITDLSLSVILTSGTLSPMTSFSSELGVSFGTSLEAPHVIDESQVWPAIVSAGPGNYPLNASYKTANGYAFQDELGRSLEEIFMSVPGGCLVFFPSYKLMEKLRNRWSATGQWSQLNEKKTLFVEPKAGSQEDFESTLKDYYNSIHQCNKPFNGRKRQVKKMGLNHVNDPETNKQEGAALLAVFRGKVSEGIDFSDDNARVVIIVGIPFPNINDVQISLKKKYNDTYKSSKNLLTGSEWYSQQAFRALNQAAGRCIRHRFDYGAIILLDERYREEKNIAYISKWLRKSIKQFDSFDLSIMGLKSFFSNVKERIGKITENVIQNYNITQDAVPSTNKSEALRRKKNEKPDNPDHCGDNFISKINHDASSLQLKSQGDCKVLPSTNKVENVICVIDLECSFEKESRCHESPWTTPSHEEPEISLVRETSCLDGRTTNSSPVSISRDGNSNSTIIEDSTKFPDQFTWRSMSLITPARVPLQTHSTTLHTPDKNVSANNFTLIEEIESPLNLSVNSHKHKRRKPMGSPLHTLVKEDSKSPKAETPASTSYTISSITGINGSMRDSNCRTEVGCETIHTERPKGDNDPHSLTCTSYPVMSKRLLISCSLCRSPLGLPENHLYVTCSFTVSSKIHLISLFRDSLNMQASACVPIVVTDISSVDKRLQKRTFEGTGHSIWCEEDGCVFNTVFCPFCITASNCLGVQIMATDAVNAQFLNKILFFNERLEIKGLETSNEKALVEKEDRIATLDSIEKFSCSCQQQNPGGWRTTKLRLRDWTCNSV